MPPFADPAELATARLSDIIEINESGNLVNAVHFGLMDDPDTNQKLCDSFIFNYSHHSPKKSTVGILSTLCDSYHSRSNPNIHLIIQQYGKGKSHFALVLANFFGQPTTSPEVSGILNQLGVATSGHDTTLAKISAAKGDRRYLTLCIQGDRPGDLRKHVLNELLRVLRREGLQESILGHQLCREPLAYLRSLDERDRAAAEAHLARRPNPDCDLQTLINLLEDNHTEAIAIVKDLVKELTNVTPDFRTEIDLEALLDDAIAELCTGEAAPFQGILILFDELLSYLERWQDKPIASGDRAAQNLTNSCAKHQSRMALVGFSQRRLLSKSTNVDVADDYQKLASRYQIDGSTYEPESSLELVLKNLIVQRYDHPLWHTLKATCDNALLSACRQALEIYIPGYRYNGWNLEKMMDDLGHGCFPLHPLTTYLLAQLDFAAVQDRTAIGFIKEQVRQHIATHPIATHGRPHYVAAIVIVEHFEENLKEALYYDVYCRAKSGILGSDDPTLLPTLQALFLYYTAGEKLHKGDRHGHELLLAELAGLTESEVRTALNKGLADWIYCRAEQKLYMFYTGSVTPRELERQIQENIRAEDFKLGDLLKKLRHDLNDNPQRQRCDAENFVRDRGLVKDDWQFQTWVYSPDELQRLLNTRQSFPEIEAQLYERTKQKGPRRTHCKGILAYVAAPTDTDLSQLRQTIDDQLQQSKIGDYLIIALPDQGCTALIEALQKRQALSRLSRIEQELSGDSFRQLSQQTDEQIKTYTKHFFERCTCHSRASQQLSPAHQAQPTAHANQLLKNLYTLAPPVVTTLKSTASTGTKIAVIAKQLLKNSQYDPTDFDKSYTNLLDNPFLNTWKLFEVCATPNGERYTVRVPPASPVQDAWEYIDQYTALAGKSERKTSLKNLWQALAAPPYGYNELTFTILLAAWLAYHRTEVTLYGPYATDANGATQRSKSKSKPSIPLQSLPLEQWAASSFLDKVSDFFAKVVEHPKSAIIRREQQPPPELPDAPMSYSVAQRYLQAVQDYLANHSPTEQTRQSLELDREPLIAPTEAIATWFAPVERFAAASHLHRSPDLAPDPGVFHPIDLSPIKAAIALWSQLNQTPPISDCVEPDPQQRDRYQQATADTFTYITTALETIAEQADTLPTIEVYYRYVDDLRDLQQHIEPFPDLTNAYDSLNYARQRADERRAALEKDPPKPPPPPEETALDQLNALRQRLTPQASQTDYAECRAAIAQLLNGASPGTELNTEAQTLLATIQADEQKLLDQLATWQTQLPTLTSSQTVSQQLIALAQQASRFTAPAEQAAIATLRQDLEHLLELIPHLPATPLTRLSDCQAAQTRLDQWEQQWEQQWRQAHPQPSPILSDRLRAARQQLAATEAEIQQRHHQDAIAGLHDLETSLQTLYQAISDEDRFRECQRLLDQAHQYQSQSASYLQDEECDRLQVIFQACHDTQNQLEVQEIEAKFQKLPRVQRRQLHERLTQYLDLPD